MHIACFTVAAMDWFRLQNQHFAGGNALNQAIHFCKAGHHAAFVGALGTDEHGKRIKKLFETLGVDTSCLRELEGNTASNTLYNDAAGERFGDDGAWQNGVYGEYRIGTEEWNFLKHFDLWSTHANCPDFAQTLKHKQQGQILATDFLHLTDLAFIEDSIPTVDIACFGGTEDLAEGLSGIAARKNALVVLTLGNKGSMAFKGKRYWKQPALPVERVVDTTGCGDAFQAAFTATYLESKGDVPRALEAGAEAGRLTCQHYGAVLWE